MTESVAGQLERLFTRLEFSEGTSIHVLAPRSWLAEWGARRLIDERLGSRQDFECQELRLAPDEDVLAPARRFADIVAASTSAVVLIHVRDDGVDVERWQPFFRRLNEVRNAVLREFRGAIIMLIAPRLVIEFAGEAPDIWSIASPLVVGDLEPEALLDAVCADLSALVGITRLGVKSGLASEQEAQALASWSAELRGRQLFELAHARGRLPEFRLTRANPMPFDVVVTAGPRGGFGFNFVSKRESQHLGIDVGGGIRWIDCEDRRICVLGAAPSHDPWDVVELVQASANADFVLGCGFESRIQESIRAGVDVVVTKAHGRAWAFEPASEARAAVVWVPPNVTIRIVPSASIRVRRDAWGHDGPQLWLPGFDPDDYGWAPLSPSDRADTSS